MRHRSTATITNYRWSQRLTRRVPHAVELVVHDLESSVFWLPRNKDRCVSPYVRKRVVPAHLLLIWRIRFRFGDLAKQWRHKLAGLFDGPKLRWFHAGLRCQLLEYRGGTALLEPWLVGLFAVGSPKFPSGRALPIPNEGSAG